jgi:hypothetical protein
MYFVPYFQVLYTWSMKKKYCSFTHFFGLLDYNSWWHDFIEVCTRYWHQIKMYCLPWNEDFKLSPLHNLKKSVKYVLSIKKIFEKNKRES